MLGEVSNTRRETIVIYGDCQAQSLFHMLRRSPEVSNHFQFVLQFVGDQHRSWRDWSDAPATLMFVQDIPQSATHPCLQSASLRKPRVIRFPSLSFPSLWPFSTAFGGQDRQADRIKAANGGGLHTDALLGALRPIKDHEKRLDAYSRLKCSPLADASRLIARREPERFHEFDAHRLRRMDEQHQTNIGRYILYNYRERRLFHLMRHPTVELLAMVARELFQKLTGQTVRLSGSVDDMGAYQIPVHPIIARKLGVRWLRDGQRYRVASDWVTIEDYTRRYMTIYDEQKPQSKVSSKLDWSPELSQRVLQNTTFRKAETRVQ